MGEPVPASDLPEKVASSSSAVPVHDLPDSVMAPPESAGSKLKRIGKTIASETAAKAAGAAPAIAGAETGLAVGTAIGGPAAPITGPIGAIIGAAAGGFASPGTEYYVRRAMGQKPAVPSIGDAVHSAAINAVWGVGGQVSANLAERASAADVAKEFQTAPKTRANFRQALRNRDFWKGLGVSDEDASAAIESPDVEQHYDRAVASAEKTKQTYQGIVDSTKQDFKSRYDEAYGALANKPVDGSPVAQSFIDASAKGGQHELTPSFRSFLERKGNELSGGALAGRVPYDELPPYVKKQVTREAYATEGQQLQQRMLAANAPQMTPQSLRGLRTELRENVPASATNLDKQAAAKLESTITDHYEGKLRELGATEEQLGRLRGIDSDYSRLMDTIKKIDPRSEKFAQSVNDALWDSARQNPEQAANFIRLAERASDLNPDVMLQLRESFLQKAIADTRVGNAPMEEMQALRKFQNLWRDEKGTQAVLEGLFGKESPIASPTTFAKVMASDPTAIEQGVQKSAGQGFRAFQPPAWLLRLGVAYGTYSLITGSPVGPWTDLRKDPARALTGLAALYGTMEMASRVYSYGSPKLQSAYTDFRLNPNVNTMRKFAEFAGAAQGTMASPPTPTRPSDTSPAR